MADTAAPPRETPPRSRALRFAEFVKAAEAGAFGRDARLELINGEIVEMSPQSAPHFQLKNRLLRWFVLHEGETRALAEPTIQLGPSTAVEPDIVVMPRAHADGAIMAAHALLVVEIAISSLDYDLNTKGPLYAEAGVIEYWVVDVEERAIIAHRAPAGKVWANVTRVGFHETLAPAAAPHLAVRFADLD